MSSIYGHVIGRIVNSLSKEKLLWGFIKEGITYSAQTLIFSFILNLWVLDCFQIRNDLDE